jgi:integrase
MPTEKLTKKLIDSAVPGCRDYIMWDSVVPGLGCKVTPAGRKVFVLKYRTKEGTQRKPTIGNYGSVTVERARELAKDMIGEVRGGGDPSLERQDARLAPTIAEVCERYLKEHARPLKKPSSVYVDELYIRLHIKPQLGNRKVASIAFKDINTLHRSLQETPYQANRVIALVSKILSLCEEWELRPQHSNPCGRVQRFPERTKHHPLRELEVARLSKVLREAETGDPPEAAENPRAIAALRLLMFTGMRRNEAIRLQWSEVDLDAGILRLPDSKTGAKVVRLNGAAREVIEAQEPMLGNPYVFPSPVIPGAPLYDVKGVWARIRKRAGLGDVRLHDLRHNFAAAAAAGGLSLFQIG